MATILDSTAKEYRGWCFDKYEFVYLNGIYKALSYGECKSICAKCENTDLTGFSFFPSAAQNLAGDTGDIKTLGGLKKVLL